MVVAVLAEAAVVALGRDMVSDGSKEEEEVVVGVGDTPL